MNKNNSSQPTPSAVRSPKSTPLSRAETVVPPDLLVESVFTLQQEGIDCKTLIGLSLGELLLRFYALLGKIEAAFAHQPYILSQAPDAPVNQHRVQAYMANMGQALKLLDAAAELERNTCAIRSERAESQPPKSVGKTRP